MKQITYTLILIIFSALANKSFGQNLDSTDAMIHKNITNNKIWGNSWYTSTSYNLSRTNEFDINIGRTYGVSVSGETMGNTAIRSWGLGYGFTTKDNVSHQLVKAFGEYALWFWPPAGIRVDYIYDITSNFNYLRPSIGFSFLHFDVFYNYSFNLNSSDNIFKSGVSFRMKYFINKKNWESHYPKRFEN